jgi:hypothetical protein
MGTKQSAVEFAVEQLEQLIPSGNQILIRAILIEAKEMEKEQIIYFANDLLAQNDTNYIAMPDLAEQYYNEQFKNK